MGVGVDAIPNFVKESPIFNGNDLGKLGNIEAIPTEEEIAIFVQSNFTVKAVLSADDEVKKQQLAKDFLDQNDTISAWKVLLAKQ